MESKGFANAMEAMRARLRQDLEMGSQMVEDCEVGELMRQLPVGFAIARKSDEIFECGPVLGENIFSEAVGGQPLKAVLKETLLHWVIGYGK